MTNTFAERRLEFGGGWAAGFEVRPTRSNND